MQAMNWLEMLCLGFSIRAGWVVFDAAFSGAEKLIAHIKGAKTA